MSSEKILGGALPSMGIISANRRMGDESIGSFRVGTRMISNGLNMGGKIVSPKCDIIISKIKELPGMHIVYS